jgi:drug/metabolite transporter (DMT)-like permease
LTEKNLKIMPPRLAALAAVVFLGIGCSGLGYLLWYSALERLDTARVAVFLYIEPLVTLATAVALLGETVHATTVLGGLIVLAGVFLVQRGAAAADPAARGKLMPEVARGDLAP